jgi:hypothetical protein
MSTRLFAGNKFGIVAFFGENGDIHRKLFDQTEHRIA